MMGKKLYMNSSRKYPIGYSAQTIYVAHVIQFHRTARQFLQLNAIILMLLIVIAINATIRVSVRRSADVRIRCASIIVIGLDERC